jgi:hypothetical protein
VKGEREMKYTECLKCEYCEGDKFLEHSAILCGLIPVHPDVQPYSYLKVKQDENYNLVILGCQKLNIMGGEREGIMMNKELKRIWDFCNDQQLELLKHEKSLDRDDYLFLRGMINAYRKIQYEINKKCTKLT